ncbi:MAG: penicillin-binding protein 2 [Anaerosomatales bacterium]|nr:penicillin-binding protein 2 [Anaerosomatales bacterium]MDT8433243.1 penicillin-binding protein 2 [Anaerosomatales bacterium]
MVKRRSARRPGRERHGLVLVLISLGLLAIGARLVYLQVYAAPAYAEKAYAQRTRDIEIAPKRGTIYDREGDPLAVSREARTIYASPRFVTDATSTAEALAHVLGGDTAEYAERLQKDSGFAYVSRKVEVEQAEAVEALGLSGIGILKDSRRAYPSGELAAQVLGFVGTDGDGLWGLEQYYDDVLSGEPGSVLAERDPFGRPIPGGVMHYEDPVDGRDIVLTIDKDIQYTAQVALQQAVEQWCAAAGSVLVMDPRSGEILAMASVPGFNPNRFWEADASFYRNRPVTDVYEPGSTFKSITAAAVIDAGLFGPESMFELPPTLKIGGRTIKEAHPRPTVNWSLTDIVTNSSNVGAVRLGMALGEKPLYDYLERFGFTAATGVDFPGESVGYLPAVENWSATSIANIPFGQGVSMTPLQLARALSAIGNGGELVTPHFLLEAPEDSGVQTTWPKKRAISRHAAAATREVMTAVITEGTGGAAAVDGYEVAGKTGTAQKARTDGRGYAAGKYIGSFSGFLPADDPQVLVIVIIDEPKGAIYGGVVAAPAFSEVASFAVSHLKIPPTSIRAGERSDSETATPADAPQ